MIGAILLAAAQFPAAPPTARLGEIRMHLFYEESGRLSDDISPPRSFAAWNTPIGGGEAEEQADNLLVVVEVRADGQEVVNAPFRIVARGANGRVLGERRVREAFTSEQGRTYAPLWLRDVGCAGEIRVTATLGAETKTETLTLNCGE